MFRPLKHKKLQSLHNFWRVERDLNVLYRNNVVTEHAYSKQPQTGISMCSTEMLLQCDISFVNLNGLKTATYWLDLVNM
jgi:hypothetical protein